MQLAICGLVQFVLTLGGREDMPRPMLGERRPLPARLCRGGLFRARRLPPDLPHRHADRPPRQITVVRRHPEPDLVALDRTDALAADHQGAAVVDTDHTDGRVHAEKIRGGPAEGDGVLAEPVEEVDRGLAPPCAGPPAHPGRVPPAVHALALEGGALMRDVLGLRHAAGVALILVAGWGWVWAFTPAHADTIAYRIEVRACRADGRRLLPVSARRWGGLYACQGHADLIERNADALLPVRGLPKGAWTIRARCAAVDGMVGATL